MPTQPTDVPLDPEPHREGDPAPVLGGSGEDAPLAPDPSLEAAVDGSPNAPVVSRSDVASVRVTPQRAAAAAVPPPAEQESEGAELARLRTQVDALLNDPLDEWVKRIQVGGVTASGFERTLSWRVTKPLRLVRTFQIRVEQLGLPGAVGHSARFVKRRLSGRAR
ncbi:hypothetical protein [Rathayibacter iranicus]|uniref:Uncharacterized protein n=2 Tax=Rathayibacter iranicus TaxID=59737 RepID=A0AAD1AE93_9MICO|nr:hypothetical protein [Rathayibacter iranicus]AZZ55792.1 hypothetical protein C7V51_07815 [Rathayibacter iranicus]MWV30783.1 hypothetical protein [Rathayibacter iranicus NCPPB 2253 = VKM Ac-1602]PPI47560.1 hypothetical protein C5E09_06850 [Rathayibacter iranicus]PPI60405.1 hypothetical protein C5E08_07780 [Rathayibacter iranicus]PPI72188.1 hypothetical protein C5E01_06825 [Rathayibacter iranicus]